jgi:hypothetical protein
MAKTPPDSPTIAGQRVALRGRNCVGVVTKINADGWTWVDWDERSGGPRICHQNELAIIKSET